MSHRFLLAAPLAAAAILATACDPKTPKVEAAAQKIDSALERTGERLANAGEKTQQALSEAGERLQPKIGEAADKLQPRLERAGEHISEAGEKVAASVKEAVGTPESRAAKDPRSTTTTIALGERTSVKASGVSDGTRAVLGDAAITASVKAGLAKDPDLSALRIDVDTQDGVVTLSGPAASEAARERALQAARSVKGVREVRDNLTVRPA